MTTTANDQLEGLGTYKFGWADSDVAGASAKRGLSEEVVRDISARKNEPEWMLEFRLKAYRHWLTMKEPRKWPNISFPEVDYQDMIYYSAPKQKATVASLDEVDPELLKTFEKLLPRWMRSSPRFHHRPRSRSVKKSTTQWRCTWRTSILSRAISREFRA